MNHRLLRRTDVESLTALSRSTIYDLIARGEFPRPVHVGLRASRWLASDIEAYIARCIANRDRSEA